MYSPTDIRPPCMADPSTNGGNGNGRDGRGRFTAGNREGRGNPHAAKTANLRAMFLEVLTEDDMRAVIDKLIEMAKGGDMTAIKELLDRAYGKSLQPILQATIGAPEMTAQDIADAEAIIARRMGRPAIEDTPVEAAALPPADRPTAHRTDTH